MSSNPFASPDFREAFKAEFEKADTNKDGFISLEEAKAAKAAAGGDWTDEDTLYFNQISKNGDGRIDLEELISFLIGVFTESFSKQTKIVCVGDSITEGECATDGNTYPKFLKDILTQNIPDTNFDILNLGVSGRTA